MDKLAKIQPELERVLGGLEEFISGAPAKLRDASTPAAHRIRKDAVCYLREKSNNRNSFFHAVEAIITETANDFSHEDKKAFRRILMARLAMDLPDLVRGMNLPASIIDLYPGAMARLLNHLKNNDKNPYDLSDDFFLKDLSFVSGGTVPCGAQVVDLASYFLFKSVIRALTRSGNINSVISLYKSGGSGPWFRIHTESRYLDEFNKEGWESCYKKIAEMLKSEKDILGMIGTSWFYDPQILKISPRLSYLQAQPVENGAFMIRHGTTRLDIERTTMKSNTRRKLYEEGKYIPASFTLFWPRQSLLNWAESTTVSK